MAGYTLTGGQAISRSAPSSPVMAASSWESFLMSEFDDGEDPHLHDLLEWHGLYKVWLNREQTYRDLLGRQSLSEQLRRAIAVT
jgi:hypothetical protein